MKYTSQHKQLVLDPSWMTLNGLPKNNRWVKPGDSLPRDKIEQIYIVNTATECLKAIFLDGFHYKVERHNNTEIICMMNDSLRTILSGFKGTSATADERRLDKQFRLIAHHLISIRWVDHEGCEERQLVNYRETDIIIDGGNQGEAELLASCYKTALDIAEEQGLKSIAFSCISTGVYGYPKEEAANIAIRTIQEHPILPTRGKKSVHSLMSRVGRF